MKEKAAKIVRVITVPPFLVAALIIILYFQKSDIFRGITDYTAALVFLGLFPVLVYPIWAAIPKLKEKGREGQRNLAFIGTLIGYTFAFLYGELSGAVPELKLIFRTYFIAVLLLTFANKVLKKRASGHACSVVSPALFLCYFVGLYTLPVCIFIIAVSFWGSLTLKRHKPMELLGGSIVCILSFVSAYLMYSIF